MSKLTLKQYISAVQKSEIDIHQYISHIYDNAKNDTHNAWIRLYEDYVSDKLADISSLTSKPLCGAPIGIKDIIMTQGYISSCGSQMLADYISPYSADCFANLEKAGAVMIGKNNMDEFAMGGSGENSGYGATTNIYATDRISGGSSSGSAVAVADGQCIASIGTDTGGSVRQPAAMCGVVGYKPSYGIVSRYGVQAMASSLDQVGVIAQTVSDAHMLISYIALPHRGHDMTQTSSEQISHSLRYISDSDDFKPRITTIQEFYDTGIDPQIEKLIKDRIDQLKSAGYTVDEISVPEIADVIAIYYIIVASEASTNLARFDGIRYGQQGDTDTYSDISAYYQDIRSRYLGPEVLRRIVMGAYTLSAGNYDEYYGAAVSARIRLIEIFADIYSRYDVVIGPTTPTVARQIGSSPDPLSDYLADIYTVTANLIKAPAISIPAGFVNDSGVDMPVGIQLMSARRHDAEMLYTAQLCEDIFYK